MLLPPLNGLRAFEAAARTGSYVAAAAELHVSPSAISRLVKLLEGRLGTALFVRRANGLTVTDAGAIYLAELTAALAAIETSIRSMDIFGEAPRQSLPRPSSPSDPNFIVAVNVLAVMITLMFAVAAKDRWDQRGSDVSTPAKY